VGQQCKVLSFELDRLAHCFLLHFGFNVLFVLAWNFDLLSPLRDHLNAFQGWDLMNIVFNVDLEFEFVVWFVRILVLA
jgi:hypothetical protein